MSDAVRERLAWVAVDWGSSHLRAWGLDERGEVLARAGSDKGMLTLAPQEYEPALLEAIGDWLSASGRVAVWVCGMAGARQGWREAAYLPVPTRLDDLARGAVAPVLRDARLEVHLLPGLCQHADATGRDFDVMRGEETQLAGLVAREPGFSGLVCLPGTHAKWAWLEAGTVMRFATALSGELYRLLASRSVLRHSVAEAGLDAPGCREAFVGAVREAAAEPGRFAQRLFGLRAADLLDDSLPAGEARRARLGARLSGLVIGLELAGMQCELPATPVTLVGSAALCERYALALETLGHAGRRLDGDTAVLAGLGLARAGGDNSSWRRI
ncbi:2-dehydro-3-deoxygalactonokinase [Halomonas sp. MCCC 1A17488]|uniref:2-dehydro-3-deoxygalactonokinase n=1 Tax=unclassified Halomonas TaxID=2609666 RepID=UPI0018D1F7F9|nr:MULTISPECIES: 2-dehydro-3-deoxygalactonokinase [unclassified Halomonas]MCE8018072.1 2-dehydro-3-deoxygalactonokinase [Halomonas sp. MCCC 1A17488]MCG3241405.1 2-dehydro-3-deoxygalactonokinase [Halomonas sp. MCCC 1A17488]QPP48633.1 2-dehydro-3-deoxygalactonokinase [Halomonas sp. SS10-MC5]